LTIVRPGLPVPPSTKDDQAVAFDDFRRWVRTGRVLAHLARHQEGRLLLDRLETAGRPLPLAVVLRALCRGPIYLEDTGGRRRPLSLEQITTWAVQLASEPFRVVGLLRGIEQEIASLESDPRLERYAVDFGRSSLYLRTDLSFGVMAGGSVGHIAGVLNELGGFTGKPIFLTTDRVPTVRSDIETHLVAAGEAFWNFRELPTFVLNDAFASMAERTLAGRAPGFVYQRYSVNNYSGVRIARSRRVPLVLEYNGSEIWMSRHWGRPLKYERLSARIEILNLRAADLIVVVSQAMQDELAARGIDCARVLVNFNGVDAVRYRPDVDGMPVRARYGLGGKVVVGFIGTFGPWHGAEVLARAFVSLLERRPGLRDTARLLMIGDGARMPEVRAILNGGDVDRCAVLTGLVQQEDGPAYLAACDVLVSPHVPNPDGTPFFGSPTKLFEYMAMGKGIVASNLDQIGDVLEHARSGWLVEPGDVDRLADGIEHLVTDADLRGRLGADARRQVLARYTWRQHTQRTIERLGTIAGAGPSAPA